MATEVLLPQFGMGMTEGKILHWFKQVGDQVEEGEPLLEIEAEKVTVEVPSPRSGILARIVAEVDETVPVRELIAIIMSPEEAASAPPVERPARRADGQKPRDTVAAASASQAAAPSNQASDMARPGVQVTPLARRVAKELGVDLRGVTGSGPGGRITDTGVRRWAAAPTPASPAPGPLAAVVQVEPRARRLAQEHKIDLDRLRGSGPGGRIVEADVRLALDGAAGPDGAMQPIIPMTGMRGVIARRMLESLQGMAQLTLNTDANVTALVEQREALKNQFDLTYTDLLVKAAALALRRHPRLNAKVLGQQIHLLPDIHIGVAVALEDGLIVPVVRDVDRKPLKTIARENRELAERARSGKLGPADVTGGTFTVTNLGTFGIDTFTPIINPPEAAILGVGRIVERIGRRNADLVWQQMMTLSLTFDHRVVDGAPAAAFLQTLRELLESPEPLSAI
jgi:pyruvate dehydrogenase E2 component (dihydrolipoamide acetyltransferase)